MEKYASLVLLGLAPVLLSMLGCTMASEPAPTTDSPPSVRGSTATDSCACDGEGRDEDGQAVLAAYQARLDAKVDKDVEALDGLLDDDLILHHISGATQTKREWLDCIANEDMRYFNIDVQELSAEVSGDTAVVRHTAAFDARIYGSRGTWTLSGESFYRLIDGAWVATNPPGA